MTDKQIIELHRLADRLDEYTIDNGPMGEYRPFSNDAKLLRAIVFDAGYSHYGHPNDSDDPDSPNWNGGR